jgi:hypothetical protein
VDINYCFVEVGRPLWREVGSVIWFSHLNCFSAVFSKFVAVPRQLCFRYPCILGSCLYKRGCGERINASGTDQSPLRQAALVSFNLFLCVTSGYSSIWFNFWLLIIYWHSGIPNSVQSVINLGRNPLRSGFWFFPPVSKYCNLHVSARVKYHFNNHTEQWKHVLCM